MGLEYSFLTHPALQVKALIHLDRLPVTDEAVQQAQSQLRHSDLVRGLLFDQTSDGTIPYHPYQKWLGAHWILASLADLAYPAGDESLKLMLNQCYDWLLSKDHQKNIRLINGRTRRCASQEGNCIYYSLALGLADDRTQELAERLLSWQWADGGWNCDKHPEAHISSFHETITPLRGLVFYARESGDPLAQKAVERAADIFLSRQLFKRLHDGSVMHHSFVELHYPSYWHYDILFGLKVLAEAGLIRDARCAAALDLLAAKRLGDGGFPVEGRYYRTSIKGQNGDSRVDWGGTSKIHANPFVSVDALWVLGAAGRINLQNDTHQYSKLD